MNATIRYLFTLDKLDRLRVFELQVLRVADGAIKITKKGILNGTIQEDREIIHPKNIGRANETTPYQQALLEIDSQVRKLLDKGYIEIPNWEDYSLQELRNKCERHKGKDAGGFLAPMLAQKDVKKVSFPAIVQAKLNGLRCTAQILDGEIIFRSRRGKVFSTLEHLEPELLQLPEGTILDGELYRHNLSLQRINSLVKRAQRETAMLDYMVFDCYIPDVPYRDRFMYLFKIIHRIKDRSKVGIPPTRWARSKEEMNKYYQEFLDEGYEGLMWKDPMGLYEPGTRSYNMIKVKPTYQEEFVIVGVEEATGRDEGTAVFVLVTKEGLTFNSRPKGTRELRREFLRKGDQLIGLNATVTFDEKSENGIPLRSRVEGIREWWDL